MSAPVQMLIGSATGEIKTTSRGYQELSPTPSQLIHTTQTASMVALLNAECRRESNVGCLQVRILVDGAVADPGDMVMTSNINYETHTCPAFKGQVPLVEGLKNPTFENKRCALGLLQAEVTVTNGKARVKSIVPRPKGAVEFDLNSEQFNLTYVLA